MFKNLADCEVVFLISISTRPQMTLKGNTSEALQRKGQKMSEQNPQVPAGPRHLLESNVEKILDLFNRAPLASAP